MKRKYIRISPIRTTSGQLVLVIFLWNRSSQSDDSCAILRTSLNLYPVCRGTPVKCEAWTAVKIHFVSCFPHNLSNELSNTLCQWHSTWHSVAENAVVCELSKYWVFRWELVAYRSVLTALRPSRTQLYALHFPHINPRWRLKPEMSYLFFLVLLSSFPATGIWWTPPEKQFM